MFIQVPGILKGFLKVDGVFHFLHIFLSFTCYIFPKKNKINFDRVSWKPEG